MIFYSGNYDEHDYTLRRNLIIFFGIVASGLLIICLVLHELNANHHVIIDIYSTNDNKVISQTLHTTMDRITYDQWSVQIDNTIYNTKYTIRDDPDF